jgi:hypothetical protein
LDGLDLYDKPSRELPLNLALERKMRRAAETGLLIDRIRDIPLTIIYEQGSLELSEVPQRAEVVIYLRPRR